MAHKNPRHLALHTSTERRPRQFDRPLDSSDQPLTVREMFGINTFGIEQMREHLSGDVVRRFLNTLEHGESLETDLADRIAGAVHEWALARGTSHFCHWFQPMTGATAEKHDAFLDFDGRRPISKFTGAQLIQSEPDASSFPSGGMRTTFEARGYTAWDPTSPMFLKETTNGTTLCIPSCFVSYYGDALDKKTPLLRSMEALNKQAVRLCRLLGENEVDRVTVTAGPEQEYFLVDRAYIALRPDLSIGGRTVLGAAAPKGQSLDDHYFGAIPSRIQACMHEVECELYKLGVPAMTRHNEVAPSQFELAVQYSEANIAADHNQLVMEVLQDVAKRHDLKALLHEKPFAGVNGSGKHLNWSMATNHGENLLNPGKTPHANLRFLAFLAATVAGVFEHADLLRAAIATHGNDFRLGANEAPPAIISVFLGKQLTDICDTILSGAEPGGSTESQMIELGLNHLPQIAKDNTDRNRTSPFAFTGNKFEFRALGSNQSISFPLTCLNTAVAKGINTICDRIEASGGGNTAVLSAIRQSLQASNAIRFEGNNYSDDWVAEAAKRGLPNLRKSPEALQVLCQAHTQSLFTAYGVLTEAELASRYHVLVEQYTTAVEIEADVIHSLVNQWVLPAAIAERTVVTGDIAALKAVTGSVGKDEMAHLQVLCEGITSLRTAQKELHLATAAGHDLDEATHATHCAQNIVPCIETLRTASDALETLVADIRWTLPKYSEMLFHN